MIVLLLFFRLEKANVYHLQAKKVKHQADAMVSMIDILTTSRQSISQGTVYQGSHWLEKYLNIKDCLEKSLKIKFALKST